MTSRPIFYFALAAINVPMLVWNVATERYWLAPLSLVPMVFCVWCGLMVRRFQ